MQRMLSIIIPTLNEEDNIPLLYERLCAVAVGSPHDFEFLFVDDGSTDRSYALVQELSAKDSRVRGVSFSRNFGSHAACLAGLTYAKGDAVAFISADLQDPPELVQLLAGDWEKGFDVVFGVREWDGKALRLFPKIYWSLVRRFALKNTPESGFDVFLIDRKVVNAVVGMGEKNTSIFGLILWSGFRQSVVNYRKAARTRGVSKWSLSKKIKLFVDTFVSFSYFPLRMMSVVGMLFALAGFLYSLVIIMARLFFATAIEGWASLMVVLLIVSGIQMIMLGVLGEYLWRNFDESRRRPPFIVRDVISRDKDTKDDGTNKGDCF